MISDERIIEIFTEVHKGFSDDFFILGFARALLKEAGLAGEYEVTAWISNEEYRLLKQGHTALVAPQALGGHFRQDGTILYAKKK